jgi:cysteine desulfurase / selenocysteine lyase
MDQSQTQLVDWEEVRSRFPALKNRNYFNSATMGQLPQSASDAVMAHLQRRDHNATSDAPKWFDDLDRLRAKLAKLIHAEASDIAMIPSTAHGLSIALNGIDWQPGDRIVTLDPEFPNNTYAPSLLASKGVEFIESPLADLAHHINSRTRLVIVSALNYVTGLRAPIAEIRRLCPNALLYVDGTQGCGALEFNVPELDIDMFAVHGYKWMLSPTGAGFLYVKPSVRKWLPPNVIGWRSHHNWRDWSNLHHGTPVLSETAERYEGYFPAMPLYYAMEQSVDLFLQLGPSVIEARVLHLAAQCRARIVALGGTVAHENTPILASKFPGIDSTTLAKMLNERNIIITARHGLLRVSLHLYNNEADIDQFAQAVSQATNPPA